MLVVEKAALTLQPMQVSAEGVILDGIKVDGGWLVLDAARRATASKIKNIVIQAFGT